MSRAPRPPRRRARKRAPAAAVPALLALAVVLAVLAGCARLPDRGPVEVEEPAEPGGSAAPFDFNPPGPVPDASREQIVAGFLRALQATPASTAPASEFLTAEAVGQWRPDRSTVVYAGARTRSTPGSMTVLLDDAFRLDGTGRFAGALTGGARELDFTLEREEGEWRIADAPDALVVPRSYFATRYRQYSLHFFDPTGTVLVPEQVHLPWGPQLPTRLVDGLLTGPPEESRAVERSYFPSGTRLGVSVPVSEDGVADVPLTAEARDLDPDDLERMLAQLAWTLRQVTDVDAFRVTVDGTPVELPPGLPAVRGGVEVTGFDEFDPAVATATTALFGLRDGAVVEIAGAEEQLVDTEVGEAGGGSGGGTGSVVAAPRALGVALSGDRFAAVSADGRRVVTFGEAGSGEEPRAAYVGTDVIAVMWDRTGRLWVVDRRPSGASVRVVHDGAVTPLAAPGITGSDVVAATLSRDGTRLGVVRRSGSTTGLAVARVQRDGAGAPRGLTAARPAPTAEPTPGARAVGWRDASTLAVLTRPSPTTTGVVLASADGASAAVRQEPSVDVLFDGGVDLATDPSSPGRLVVLGEGGRLHSLDPQGRWDLDVVPEGVAAVTFAG